MMAAMSNETRSCCRCGREFQSHSRSSICAQCHKPATSTELTFREQQVVDRIVQAMQNKQIAYELHLSEGTIKEYMNRIFRKLGVSSRTALALWELNRKKSL